MTEIEKNLARAKARIDFINESISKATDSARIVELSEKLEAAHKDYQVLVHLAKKAKVNVKKRVVNNEAKGEKHIARHKAKEGNAVDEQRLLVDLIYFMKYALDIVYRPGMNKKHPSGGFGPFIASASQKKVLAVIIRKLLVEQVPLRMIILKTRQLGNTTMLLALATWMMMIRPHYHVMFIIDKDDHARTKRRMVIKWIDDMSKKFQCFSGIAKGGRDSKALELENGSKLFFESSQSPNPGTSEMIHMLIESEKPKWVQGRAAQINNSITPGIPFAPFTAHIDESTAMGQEEFYRKWLRASTGKSDFIPIFLPWSISPEYSLEPPPNCYDENGDFIFLNNDPEVNDFDEDLDREITEEEFAKKYRLTSQQVFWRRTKIKGQFDGVRSGFDQEYPISPGHAFRASQHGFFSKRARDRVSSLEKSENIARYDIVDANGHIDFNRTPNYATLKPKLKPNRRGNLFIREMPVRGEQYYAGVDIAEGKVIVNEKGKDDPDRTVMSIKNERGITVAMYICRLRPEEAWLDVLLTALYFNHAFINAERNSSGGTLLVFLLNTYYSNMLYSKSPRGAPARDRAGTVLTKANRKPELERLRALYKRVPESPIPVVHEETSMLVEMTAFIVNKDGKPEAAPGFHDDLIMAEMHANIMLEHFFGKLTGVELKEQAAPVREPDEGTLLATDIVLWDDVNVDDMFYDEERHGW